jgi:Kyakuja-Dileera-Zisupton transposase
MYDVACTFKTYLQSRMNEERFKKLDFAVSIFHSYGHGIGCQCLHSPRRVEGAGLTDGEWCERIWAWIR